MQTVAVTASVKEIYRALIDLTATELELAALGPRSQKRKSMESNIDSLRQILPPTVLSHHNRIRAKGRPSVAPVRRWICQGCFIGIPMGQRRAIMVGQDLALCESCGAFLYYVEEPQPPPAAEAKPKPKPKAKRGAAA
jgi:predicted  nucleic acid-binding Zn-ribbon protein